MPVALVYPPTCDPTAPYLSVPMLTGFLRSRGVEVLPIDANVEAYDALLRHAPLARLAERVERRLERLNGRDRLTHVEQRSYAALWQARGDAAAVPDRIEAAVATLRSERAFDPRAYDAAVQVIEAALRLISAAYSPLELSFTGYRTPFSLLTPEEIELDAQPDRDPFHDYCVALAERLRHASVIGISVVFPGQMQPAYSFAHTLRKQLGEGVHLTVGGPALTQLAIRIRDDAARLARVLGPFDSAICYEGETPLFKLCEALAAGGTGAGIPNVVVRGGTLTPGGTMEDLRALPAPDFDGLPLDKYLSPALVLPYDPTRGCYWGVCTFCHYGLAEKGTAPYKERAVATVLEHLGALSARHGTRYFYLSQDSVAPKTLLKLAQGIRDSGLDVRWATDMKPEKYLTPERARTLRDGGAIACALGVESAAPRVLKLINKGAGIDVVADVIDRLAAADVAVEAMCFTDFPTETTREALATVRFLAERRDRVSLFILGEFDLTPGSLVAQTPREFGLSETWRVAGDELGIGLFYEEARPPKRDGDQERIDQAVSELGDAWLLRRYPWAGSLSTAHTILWYDRFGRDVFRKLRSVGARVTAPERVALARFDPLQVAARAGEREMAIWHELVRVRREVSRAAYRALADAEPPMRPAPRRYAYAMGMAPAPVGRKEPAASPHRRGRRARTDVNHTKIKRPTW
jgi:hypothetical protein